MRVGEGVLIPPTAAPDQPRPDESPISLKIGQTISRLLSPRPGDLALIIAPLPETILDRWGSSGVERVQVDLQAEALISRRARSCANGHGLAHYIEGPLDLDVFRHGQFDQVVISLPSTRLTERTGNLAVVPMLLRSSGRAVLTFSRDGSRANASERIKTYMENLPGIFEMFKSKLITVQGEDLLLLEHHEDRCILPTHDAVSEKK